jgi:hypothetical protein
MHTRRRVPRWIRLGFEAGAVGAGLSCASLLAFQLSRPEPRLVLPNGLDGAMILAPAVMALAVFSVCYPTFLAATRGDAVLGAVAAFIVAADALMLVSVGMRESVLVHAIGRSLPLGLVAAGLAVPAAFAALLAGPVTSALGFGRAAGLRAALAGALVGVAFLFVGAISI